MSGLIVVNKSKTALVNVDHVAEIYLSDDGLSIRMNFENGNRYCLERYEDSISARQAMEMLCEACGRGGIFRMPNEKELQARRNVVHDGVPRHISGKKNKGHGGS